MSKYHIEFHPDDMATWRLYEGDILIDTAEDYGSFKQQYHARLSRDEAEGRA